MGDTFLFSWRVTVAIQVQVAHLLAKKYTMPDITILIFYSSAIYPEESQILGYCKGEPVYARECVHTVSDKNRGMYSHVNVTSLKVIPLISFEKDFF